MTWTFGGDPAANDRDQVRFLVGDTDTTDQLATDEAIAWAIAQRPSVYSAAATIARGIAALFSRRASTQVGNVQVTMSQMSKQYLVLAQTLEAQANIEDGALGTPVVMGVSRDEMYDVRDDEDRVRPSMTRDMHRDRGIGQDYEDEASEPS